MNHIEDVPCSLANLKSLKVPSFGFCRRKCLALFQVLSLQGNPLRSAALQEVAHETDAQSILEVLDSLKDAQRSPSHKSNFYAAIQSGGSASQQPVASTIATRATAPTPTDFTASPIPTASAKSSTDSTTHTQGNNREQLTPRSAESGVVPLLSPRRRAENRYHTYRARIR